MSMNLLSLDLNVRSAPQGIISFPSTVQECDLDDLFERLIEAQRLQI